MITQIYEIQSPEEAEKCIELGVDHIGSVILDEIEWRQTSLKDALTVTEGTPVKSSIIPLFKGVDEISKAIEYYRPDLIHFCDSLTDMRGREIELDPFIQLQIKIKERYPEIEIIRSIPIPSADLSLKFHTLKIARELESSSDFFLTDTWTEKAPVEGFIGITGRICDWEIARELVLQSHIPVILAGGLSPENVREALLTVCPAGADSCTQTNKLDKAGHPIRFKKDFERVKRFVKEVRRAQRDVAVRCGELDAIAPQS
jgi:phosphoribosylanthranilate isomerase